MRTHTWMMMPLCYALLIMSCSLQDGNEIESGVQDTLSIVSHTFVYAEDSNSVDGFVDVRDICFGHDGSMMLVDLTLDVARRYSPEGEYIMSYGLLGEDSTALNEPISIAVDASEHVYVADHNGLNRFDLETGEWHFTDESFT